MAGAPTLVVVPGATGRVLVVDDNKVIRQLIRVNLELEGFEVVTATDGVECLDIVHEVRPDVITLDVVMPRLDGLRTAARLRADPRTRDVPLAVVSACTESEVDRATDAGVDSFLAKPFEPDSLVAVVRQLMEHGRRRALRVATAENSAERDGAEDVEGSTAAAELPVPESRGDGGHGDQGQHGPPQPPAPPGSGL
ncbi:response regulator [Streptomyces sp. NPDC049954]|uniref:response regulator n=1 Tax=Streptomyces sp. NPDC049954 TaxID=3155779 RepID=UPI00343080F3